MKKLFTIAVLLVFGTTVLLPATYADTPEANFDETIVMAEAAWPGIEAKAALVSHILENIGYEVSVELLDVPLILQSLAEGQMDIWLGAWMPSEEPTREGLEGEFEIVRTHLEEALYITAVPDYVYEAGVRCHSDLEEYADRFGRQMLIGPMGEGADEALSKAAEEDIYGLADWEMINADWGATIAHAEEAFNNEEWVVFPGWMPHWMNILMDIEYLEDPEGIWGEAESRVETLIRNNFREDHPNLYTFLENFKITPEMQSEWLYAVDREERPVDELAEEWIADNIDVVDLWLFGVVAADGQLARHALREEMGLD